MDVTLCGSGYDTALWVYAGGVGNPVGCNDAGWTVVTGDENGSREICGFSGTYLYDPDSYRDTDWYDATGDGVPLTFACTAEFPLQILFIYAASGELSCSNFTYDPATAPPCVEASLTRRVADGTHLWPWVGGSTFTGFPCTSKYWMRLTGLEPAPAPSGACCRAHGTCLETSQSECSGSWRGEGTTCLPNPCTTPTRRTSWGSIKQRYRP